MSAGEREAKLATLKEDVVQKAIAWQIVGSFSGWQEAENALDDAVTALREATGTETPDDPTRAPVAT